MTPATQRLDAVLVQRDLARSRGQARDLVTEGLVRVDGRVARKASHPVAPAAVIEVEERGPRWVSRAAYKLVGALERWGDQGLDPAGARCLDAGASTGGFTQVLLHHGAAHVVALDVGHDQLVAEIAADERVHELSGTTVRGLTPETIGGPVELVVADLSFISLTLVLADLLRVMGPDAQAMVLVKPQFEVGRSRLGKGGIVRSAGDRAWALTEVARAAVELGLGIRGMAVSPVRGGEGNTEYLLWLTRGNAETLTWEAVVTTADELSVRGAE
ncbi:MAG: TlyA family RNA methyltransferase [Micrococcales bacterium]|nr:TlyA family RNA methyltransferase [Micrococcales bacterium]